MIDVEKRCRGGGRVEWYGRGYAKRREGIMEAHRSVQRCTESVRMQYQTQNRRQDQVLQDVAETPRAAAFNNNRNVLKYQGIKMATLPPKVIPHFLNRKIKHRPLRKPPSFPS